MSSFQQPISPAVQMLISVLKATITAKMNLVNVSVH